MGQINKNFWLVLAVIAGLLYVNYNNKLNIITRSGLAMNTLISITLESKNKSEVELNKILDEAFDYLKIFEAHVSLYDENSQVNKINKMAGIAPVEVSSDVIALALKSVEINKLTHNIFNPLIGAVTKLWKINEINKKLPEPASIDNALNFLDINIISLDLDLNKIYLSKAGAVLDFSGIANGYASRRLA
ncbi:MAG: FAD:protein FMN transferase, partial [Synergistaceae bacterium]|nr:FAD:protein FMN transferase [Synergistaceae bacterium]